MSIVIIKLAPPAAHKQIMLTNDIMGISGLLHDRYEQIGVRCDLEGEEAAEEMFDLTNNPSREEERAKKYGNRRSLSVGDVVQVGDDNYICASMGWRKI